MKVKSAGGLQPFVSLTFLRNHPFPLPPLAEQKRIVAKVDACFAKLDATDAQLAHAERLVGQCRKSILNQAVRGQLLPQDANDEPAIELLKRIQAEKPVSKKTRHPEHREGSPERGVAGGGEILRCTQDDGVGGVEHPPFEIPPSWVWTRLGEAFNLVGGSTPSTSQARFYSENAIKWLTPADLSKLDDVYIYSGKKDITEAGLKSCSSQVIPKNSIVYSTRAPIGHIAIAGVDLCTNQGFKNIVIENPILSKYTFYYLKHMTPYIQSKGSGTTFLEVSMTVMKQVPYCLPPLAEQKRIVAKVDACFAKLDALAEQLKTQRQHIQHSKKALLQRAVSGRLVPQIPEEGTGHDLLKQIQAEKPVNKKTRHPDPEASEGEGSPPNEVAGAREILRCTQDDKQVQDDKKTKKGKSL